MPMPRSPRSIGRLMFATLLFAVLVGDGIEVARLQRLAQAYRRAASVHEIAAFEREQMARSAFAAARALRLNAFRDPVVMAEADEDAPVYVRRAERLRRSAAREGELAEKYRSASRYPFLPIWPDPPDLE